MVEEKEKPVKKKEKRFVKKTAKQWLQIIKVEPRIIHKVLARLGDKKITEEEFLRAVRECARS